MFVVFIRTLLLYIIIMIGMRLMGKRQIGDLQPTDLVVTILISNMAAIPIEDTDVPMMLAVIPIISLITFEIYVSIIGLKNRRIRRALSGRPVTLIKNGQICQKHMAQLRFSIDDLMASLRQKDIFDITEVDYAIVETNGLVSVRQTFDAKTVTPQIMEIKGSQSQPPVVVISDGKLIKGALETYNLGEGWLQKTLQENKTEIKQVFLLTVDNNAKYFLVKENKA